MRRLYELSMNSGRKTEIVDEEIEEYDNTEEINNDWEEDTLEDEEPYEREYCD